MIFVIKEHNRRRSELSNAPLDMEYDNNRDHRDHRDHRDIAIAINIQQKPLYIYIFP